MHVLIFTGTIFGALLASLLTSGAVTLVIVEGIAGVTWLRCQTLMLHKGKSHDKQEITCSAKSISPYQAE